MSFADQLQGTVEIMTPDPRRQTRSTARPLLVAFACIVATQFGVRVAVGAGHDNAANRQPGQDRTSAGRGGPKPATFLEALPADAPGGLDSLLWIGTPVGLWQPFRISLLSSPDACCEGDWYVDDQNLYGIFAVTPSSPWLPGYHRGDDHRMEFEVDTTAVDDGSEEPAPERESAPVALLAAALVVIALAGYRLVVWGGVSPLPRRSGRKRWQLFRRRRSRWG